MNLQQTLTRPPFLWSASAIVITALITLALIVPVFGVLFQSGTGEPEVFSKLEQYQAEHVKDAAIYEARVKGRYLFSSPPPPKRPEPEPVAQKPDPQPQPQPQPKPQEPQGPPPPPANYSGPGVRFVVGETVYFMAPSADDKPFSVSVGQELHGVKVLSTENLPRSVRLGHKGGEYDVEVFENWNAVAMVTPPNENEEPEPESFITEVEPAAEVEGDAGPPEQSPADGEAEAEASAEERRSAGGGDAEPSQRSSAPANERNAERSNAGRSSEPATQPASRRPSNGREAGAASPRRTGRSGSASARNDSDAGSDDAEDAEDESDEDGGASGGSAENTSQQHARLAPRDDAGAIRLAQATAGPTIASQDVITGQMTRWPVAL